MVKAPEVRTWTEQYLKGLKVPEGQSAIELQDPKTHGLRFRVRATGVKSWTFLFRPPGSRTKTRLTLGRFPAVGLAAARAAATRHRAALANGKSPKVQQQEARLQARGGLSFDELCDTWIERHARVHKKARSAEDDIAMLKRAGGPREVFGTRAVADLTRLDLVEFLDAIKVRAPISANRHQALIHSILRWGANAGLVDNNPLAGLDKRGGAEVPRNRVLDDAELRAVWKDLCNEESPNGPVIRNALKFVLLTACRISEATDAERDELAGLHGRAPAWTIPAGRSKNSRPHVVPLSSLAVEVLDDAGAYVAMGAGGHKAARKFIFPQSGIWTKPTTRHAAASACADIVTRTGIAHFSPHDLRRSAANIMERAGVAPFTIEACLNHLPPKLQRTYQVHDRIDERRAALDLVAEHVVKLTAQ